MTLLVLGVIGLLQIVFLILLVGAVVAERTVLTRRQERLARERRRFVSALQRYLRLDIPDEARAILGDCDLAIAGSVLQSIALQVGGDEWDKVAQLVHDSGRMTEVEAMTRSLLWWRRLEGARLFSLLARPCDEPVVLRLVGDRNAAVRIAAAAAVDRLNSTPLVCAVLDFAIASGGVVSNYLTDLLCANRASLLEVLLDRLEAPGSDEELTTVLRLVGELAVPSLVQKVALHVEHENVEVRIAAARALGSLPHRASSRALRSLMHDSRWQVRAQAAASLGSIGAVEAAGDLETGLTDPSWWVRLRSGLSLRRLGAEGELRLRNAPRSDDPFARDMACYVLGLSPSAMAEYSGTGLVNHRDAFHPQQVA